jgi:hypothetical protein
MLTRYTCYMSQPGYEVERHRDHLEIRGLTGSELDETFEQLSLIRDLQAHDAVSSDDLTAMLSQLVELIGTLKAERTAEVRDELTQVLMSREVSLIPPATLIQAQRLAAHRNALLATPVFTHETLSELRGNARPSSTRTWLTRRRDEHALFTVNVKGTTVIPAFQLDESGEPRRELQPIVSALHEGGIEDWSLWTWLTKPTSFLSGGVPEEVARTNPERALRAAQRFAPARVRRATA